MGDGGGAEGTGGGDEGGGSGEGGEGGGGGAKGMGGGLGGGGSGGGPCGGNGGGLGTPVNATAIPDRSLCRLELTSAKRAASLLPPNDGTRTNSNPMEPTPISKRQHTSPGRLVCARIGLDVLSS